MIFLIPAYFVVVIIVFLLVNKRKDRFTPFPKLKVTRFGLSFYSISRHRLKIDDASMITLNKAIYLKKDNQLVTIKNVDKSIRENGYLYFSGLGEVMIYMDMKNIYKYFNINVSTPKLDFVALKNKASQDILTNVFDMSKCRYVNSYMKLIKMLNITFLEDKLIIKPNKFHLSYTLTYKLNNKIKKVHIEDTI